MTMSKNIFVGNLPFSTTSDELREMFAEYGNVTRAQVATDRDTGRSRGFGFVEMAEGFDEAIAALNGADFNGRPLTVNEAKPREDRGARTGGTGGGGGGGSRGGYGIRY
jgi:RNA recognition motif-containing protein